ncbi:flagellar basal body-associated FliL family protein [Plastorhodobacter daqingensis]|uniref:Flagellar basal body-associated FliL family protein n=1 Tax=Plastorhodobacter daqingensis TaxID=1387281 RepID=A0ABW2UHF1_9RHOB
MVVASATQNSLAFTGALLGVTMGFAGLHLALPDPAERLAALRPAPAVDLPDAPVLPAQHPAVYVAWPEAITVTRAAGSFLRIEIAMELRLPSHEAGLLEQVLRDSEAELRPFSVSAVQDHLSAQPEQDLQALRGTLPQIIRTALNEELARRGLDQQIHAVILTGFVAT